MLLRRGLVVRLPCGDGVPHELLPYAIPHCNPNAFHHAHCFYTANGYRLSNPYTSLPHSLRGRCEHKWGLGQLR